MPSRADSAHRRCAPVGLGMSTLPHKHAERSTGLRPTGSKVLPPRVAQEVCSSSPCVCKGTCTVSADIDTAELSKALVENCRAARPARPLFPTLGDRRLCRDTLPAANIATKAALAMMPVLCGDGAGDDLCAVLPPKALGCAEAPTGIKLENARDDIAWTTCARSRL
eukprot:CAMPEP_0115383096 /NCGR_PEP_ID=MMETSP0271-20121206/6421_1 /TAXON_ID=71861 /ORGANISM="Scrippsiella trochoidea, Strain CCMP3099" /LENGTH=166 /DNA_ID=CAMNT_0002806419 /DNA_START=504 /DNA_END=1000 /DNA_ORIENTATION=-